MKKFLKKTLVLLGEVFFPFTFLSALWLKFIRKAGIGRLSDSILMRVGILPVADHYYEPLINPRKHLSTPLNHERILPGIDMNVNEQLALLASFKYEKELKAFPHEKTDRLEYFYNNESFLSGDSEYLYNMVRHFKPRKIVEIGSGLSTLMAQNALNANRIEDTNYTCRHICIEPYEIPWLEILPIEVVRKKVEEINRSEFDELQPNDILFIDSSHIIRPQGDVLFEYLYLLPIIPSGVLVHVHDIFTPRDYLDRWIIKEHRLWNEQYLLEAFLTYNNAFKVIGAVNFLTHNHRALISKKCPILAQQPYREPGSFWMRKI